MTALIPSMATNSFGFPMLKVFLTSKSRIMVTPLSLLLAFHHLRAPGFPSFPDHLGVGVHVLVRGFHGLIKTGNRTAVLLHEMLRILLLFKSPFRLARHDTHLASSQDPESLIRIDQGLGPIVPH